MNVFDKICAVLAGVLGVVLLVLGAVGTFIGCRFWFTLPPVLGILPALAGWGICRAVYFGWKYRRPPPSESVPPAGGAPFPPQVL